MAIVLFLHITAGLVGLLSGATALYALKGASLHRRSGMVFVSAMLPMSAFGAAIAAVNGVAPAINIPAALLTAYLVITALVAVRPLAMWSRWFDVAAMLVALAVGLVSLNFGIEALGSATGRRAGIPPFPFFMFGVVGLLAGVSDLRIIRSGPLQGTPRLARHLWRMCFALFIAALSFFIGQAKVFPKPIRIVPLLAMPVVAVLATMLYWMWRIRMRHTSRRIVPVNA